MVSGRNRTSPLGVPDYRGAHEALMDTACVGEETALMSDDLGLTWKLSFGAMVLAFSALVTVVRTPPVITPVAAPTAAAIQPLPLLEITPGQFPVREVPETEAAEQAPVDAVDNPPVRIQVSLFDAVPRRAAAVPPQPPRPPQVKRGAPVAKAKPAVKVHVDRALVARVSGPYRTNGPHYPFDPRERRTGDQAFAPGR